MGEHARDAGQQAIGVGVIRGDQVQTAGQRRAGQRNTWHGVGTVLPVRGRGWDNQGLPRFPPQCKTR